MLSSARSAFLKLAAHHRQAIVRLRVGPVQREQHVIQARLLTSRRTRAREPHTVRDAVMSEKPDLARVGHELEEVLADGGLAARKIERGLALPRNVTQVVLHSSVERSRKSRRSPWCLGSNQNWQRSLHE